jgi:hypothetical protein
MRSNITVMQNDDLRITVVLGRETVASIDVQAAAEYRSRSAQMRHMLERLAAPLPSIGAKQPTEDAPRALATLPAAHEHIKGGSTGTAGIRTCVSQGCEARFVNGKWTS